jgi:hypothetical protein
MDKPLSDTQKKDGLRTDSAHATAQSVIAAALPTANAPSFGAYAGKTTNLPPGYLKSEPQNEPAKAPDLSSKAWEESKNTPWNATPQGRLAIHTFSRGVMGAAFFAVGGLIAEKAMKGYDSSKGFSEQKNTLQNIAKGIDAFVGEPIRWLVGSVAGKDVGDSAVSFRTTKWQGGRSLGAEVVGITFDFFCASIGDALGRDIVNQFDPGVKQKGWHDEKGNFSITASVKNAAKTAWRYVTYNGGEDWAVAIPYAYFMKAQRSVINHFSPGFKYDFDRSLNGGSFKMGDDNKVKGAYGFEGALDLQSRFMVYNMGTLMYREAYNHIADKIAGKPSALYGAPDADHSKKGILEKIGDLGKWTARSIIKAGIYMAPAVPFFWITRSAQSKGRGAFIHPEKGILSHEHGTRKNAVRANELADLSVRANTVYYAAHNDGVWTPTTAAFSNPIGADFESYAQGGNLFDRAFDKIGGVNKQVLDHVNRTPDIAHPEGGITTRMDKKLGAMAALKNIHPTPPEGIIPATLGAESMGAFNTRFINAAISYTPYMYAKAEFANLWDDGKTDTAVERLINGATSFNWGEFKAGAGEVWRAITKQKLADPAREAEAQRRITIDQSAPVDFIKTHAERTEELASKSSPSESQLSWQERMVACKAAPKFDSSRPVDSRPKSYAESEAMKKALEEATPPTNAIN